MKHLLVLFLGLILTVTGCSQATYPDRSTHVSDSVSVDHVLFWPAGLRYLAVGESTIVELAGLQRGFINSRILECRIGIVDSAADSAALQPYVRIELPADPTGAVEGEGVDTSLRIAVTRPAGSMLYLRTRNRVRTDSVRMVAAVVYAESLTYVRDTTGRITKGKFTFRDSSSSHPDRTVYGDSLRRCETLQGAVYSGKDTVRVHFHRLVLDSIHHAALKPCAGIHADTILAVSNRFGFPLP